MRLICPNCDAQYEVDDSAIPEGGRDVQCSNCGHAWYQLPVGEAEEIEAEEGLFGAPLQQDTAQTVPPSDVQQPAPTPAMSSDTGAIGEPEPSSGSDRRSPDPDRADTVKADAVLTGDAPVAGSRDGDAGDGTAGDEPERPSPISDATIPRRALDESLLAVLKEEAEREAAARRAEQRPIETQTDLGLEETGNAAALRQRLAQLRAPDPDPEPEVTDRRAARRDLLPDIEEINSTLRASSENRTPDDHGAMQSLPARRSSGFRSGFFLMLFLAVVAASTYVAAPRISQQFPAAAEAMSAYVSGVNRLRAGLDSLLLRATGGLQSMGGD